jgi:predicted DNA-binding transcriptional regulator AlpA
MTEASNLIPRKLARQRLGNCSDMTIWRLEHDPDSGFPTPVMIHGRAYYFEHEFSAWLATRPRKQLQREVA